ncbi:MAG: phosphotransferase [Gammaproteobacteria bacterium]|nr:phosphotransferase [Gammaproteobacteria bacterium]
MAQDPRLEQLTDWLLNELNIQDFSIEPASADASFRRYFRISTQNKTWVAMDAPPDKENCAPFVHVAQMIEAVGVQAPHIYHYNPELGFMLLSDLGSLPYLTRLDDRHADGLYKDAIEAIVKMQSLNNGLSAYDTQLLNKEMQLFSDWYLAKHLGIELSPSQQKNLSHTFDILRENALQQPQVFVHRDYHSRNLMITAMDNPGVIDFQDAVVGPISYDLVSLLKDCYIAWPRQKMLNWLDYFMQQSSLCQTISREQFIHWFELMGMQRHLKAIGIFSRLNHRDGKPGYLDDIPRTLAYVIDCCRRYDELHGMAELIEQLQLSANLATLDLIQ